MLDVERRFLGHRPTPTFDGRKNDRNVRINTNSYRLDGCRSHIKKVDNHSFSNVNLASFGCQSAIPIYILRIITQKIIDDAEFDFTNFFQFRWIILTVVWLMQSTMDTSLPRSLPDVALATRPVSTYLWKGCAEET